MTGEVLQSVWIILAVLAYLLVTCVLMVLSHARKRSIDIHNRVRECMEIRAKYHTAMQEAKNAK